MKQFLFVTFLLTVWASNAQTVTFSKRIDIDHLADIGFSVIEVSNGFVIYSSSEASVFNGYFGAFIVKTDLSGSVQWAKGIGESGKLYFSGYSRSFQSLGSGFIGCGVVQTTNGDNGFIVRYDGQGDTLWLREFGGNGDEALLNCVVLPNGNIAAAGITSSMGDTLGDFYLVVVDSAGNTVLEKKYGSSNRDFATNIDVAMDGGFVLGGGTYGAGAGSLNNLLVKTDSLGTLEWYKTFGTVKEDCGLEVRTSRYGGYYVWGCMDTLKPNASGTTPYLAKLDSSGNLIWRNFFSKIAEVSIWDFEETASGQLTFTGMKYVYDFGPEQGWLVKMDSTGNILWERTYQYVERIGTNPTSSWFRGFRPTSDGGFIVTGMCRVGWNDIDTTGQDIWLLKLDSMGCLVPGCDTVVPCLPPCDTVGISMIIELNAKIYPNPTNGQITIELPNVTQAHTFTLYNLLGERLMETAIIGTATLKIEQPAGIYLYRITAPTTPWRGALSGKLVVE